MVENGLRKYLIKPITWKILFILCLYDEEDYRKKQELGSLTEVCQLEGEKLGLCLGEYKLSVEDTRVDLRDRRQALQKRSWAQPPVGLE